MYATVGLHPIHTEKSYHDKKELGASGEARAFTSRGEEFGYEQYKKLAAHPKVVAIGECGLDYAVFVRERSEQEQKQVSAESYSEGGLSIEERKRKQKAAFIRQIELALEIKKPLMVHCRNAFDDLIEIFDSYFVIHNSDNPGIIHFFSGTKEDAEKLLDLGFSFSFGGVVTFARDYDEVVKYIPLDRIMLETDAPYVAPAPYRGKRNEPVYVIEVAKKISELKELSFEEITAKTTDNARQLFGI